MIAAIYARKSTDQSGVSDEQRSVARQIEHAKAYAARKGWTVLEDHVFSDDGISGAEFANRPGLLRLMNAIRPRRPFDVLIMSEESRLGREAIETAYALKQLIQAGVRVFFYLEDRERTFDSPTDKLLMSVTAFADELEREKARQRTYDAMQRKAKAGHVTGGRVFGYDNVEVRTPDGQRSDVERRINETEAAVVRRIFEMCAAGAGLTRITKTLNAESVPAPRPQQGRPRAWATSSVRSVLLRPLYHGEIRWNASQKRDRWGQQRQHARPESDWIRTPAPHLQIVPGGVWSAAQAQLTERQATFANAGRQYHESRYLLSGFARCGVCGGGFATQSRTHGKHRVHFYACTSHWKRGGAVCSNNLVGRMDLIDAEVLATSSRSAARAPPS
jgi:DNA invertase Pin-like site-specific DNA recombinase